MTTSANPEGPNQQAVDGGVSSLHLPAALAGVATTVALALVQAMLL